MRILRAFLWTSVSAAALGAFGCDVFLGGRAREDRVYVQSQPVYVEQQPQYIVVQQAPPAMRVERRPAAPSAAHIWIDGSWNWDSRQYVWVGGRYEVPPQPDVVWIAPRYESVGATTHYTPGQWSKPKGKPDQGPGQGDGRGRGRGGN